MLTRCHNEKSISFRYYGARGIVVCEEWRESFEAFLSHVGEAPSSGHSLDRISSALGYEPGNVRWALRADQARNRRSTHMLTFAGETMCVKDWADRLGISRPTLSDRLRRGWPAERALTEKIGLHPERQRLTVGGKTMTVSEWAAHVGMSVDTLASRLWEGWTPERAVTEPTRHKMRRS